MLQAVAASSTLCVLCMLISLVLAARAGLDNCARSKWAGSVDQATTPPLPAVIRLSADPANAPNQCAPMQGEGSSAATAVTQSGNHECIGMYASPARATSAAFGHNRRCRPGRLTFASSHGDGDHHDSSFVGGDCSWISWAAVVVVPAWSSESPFAISNSSGDFFDISLDISLGLLLVLLIGILAPHVLKRKRNTCKPHRSPAPQPQVAAKLQYALYMGLLPTVDAFPDKTSLQVALTEWYSNQAPSGGGPNSADGAKVARVRPGQTLAKGTRKPRLPSHAWSGRSTKPGAAAHSTGNRAFPRGHCLLLGLLAMAHAASATVFATKAEVAAALVEFCTDQAVAEATHGTIGAWGVSAVTDMSRLIEQAPCAATFDANISGWVTSSVTTMARMFYVRSARALPPQLGHLPAH